MKIIRFNIENFKGIKSCKIDVVKPKSRIISLIGLNESGKTTILEAINYFVAADQELQKVYEIESARVKKSSFVPKHRKSNFNDEIKISALIEIEKSDIEVLKAALIPLGYNLDETPIRKQINVTQYFRYENSDFKIAGRTWDIVFNANKFGSKKKAVINATHPCWNAYHTTLIRRIPQICYFPSFLFELPDRIYLEERPDETPINAYYRRLIQDILDSLGDGLNIETHIIKRIRDQPNNWTWLSFWDSDRKEQVNHVLLRASAQITRVVMDSWRRVFNKSLDSKRIELEYAHDVEKDAVYLKMYLIDGSEKYEIGNRSLGFRWFFCFWLFTHFRSLRQGSAGTVFLLDEPASNLHARAQEELLNNLAGLTGENNTVIYSTHSHYLVNPRWIDGSYIVTNGAVSYNGIEDEFLSSGETNIKATPYREFVSKHPNQRTYFLPILDALEYRPSEIALNRPTLLVEGKADFAFLKCVWLNEKINFTIVPCNGAKSMGPLVSMLTGWGLPFVILLDDDKEGRDARDMYKKSWNIDENAMKTIGDMLPEATSKSLENVILMEMKDEISKHFNVEKLEKFHAQAYLYEKMNLGESINISANLELLSRAALLWATSELGKI